MVLYPKLKEIVAKYRRQYDFYNSYNWYRQYAKDCGYITIGGIKIPVSKEEGSWYIDEDSVNEAINRFQEKQEEIRKHQQQMERDYKMGIYHSGSIDLGNGKYYSNYGDFRFEWNSYDVMRKRSDGEWICNKCNKYAKTEHNNPECHTCSDWGGCGRDCTLSKVFCSDCGKVLPIP